MAQQARELEEPSEEDCCGNGCSPCVFDIYRTRLLSYKQIQSCGQKHRTDLLSETCFKPFVLLEKLLICENVYKFRFKPKQQHDISVVDGVLPYCLGQHLVLRCYIQVNKNLSSLDKHYSSVRDLPKVESKCANVDLTKMITRAYTPVSIAQQENNCCFDILVKFYSKGSASCYFKEAKVNDVFYWRGPYGDFHYETNSFKHILMVCMGTGIAPFIPLLSTILDNEVEDTVLHLMYGVKNIYQLIVRDRLRSMCQYWNFTLEYYFSQDTEANYDMKFGECFKLGRIGKNSIKEYLDGKDLDKVLVMVCGSDKFSNEIKSNVLDLGVNCNNNLHIF